MRFWRPGNIQAVERVGDAMEADARVLDHLVALGCDPAAPRECRHYFYVPAELAARAVARSLHGDGWDAEVEAVHDVWLVTASTHMALSDGVVRSTRLRLELLAHDHGGQYDGWEAAAD
jgi:Regulator of ribonuclease activity B